ncbi:MAG: AAA family ATPase [Chloroflexi bacterium]|nr:AAA family ATPase [Chloroflexota bacterium]
MALEEPAIIVVSGIQGAGKSTVARLLAERFSRAVYIEADTLQRMIVSGGEWMGEPGEPPGEAGRQLRLRLHHACLLARSFFEAGFTAVVDDIIIGKRFDDLRADLAGVPFRLVVLAPDVEIAIARDAAREYTVGEEWARYLDEEQRRTMAGSGLWVDSSGQTAAETVDEVMSRLDGEGLVESEAS